MSESRPFVLSSAILALGFFNAAVCQSLHAQSGLQESLERLDRNSNGSIDPDEITPLARPFLERVAESRRMDINRSNSIKKWQEAARIHFALKNGVSGRRIEPEEVLGGVQGFDRKDEDILVPEFGLADVKYRYTQEDLEDADNSLRRNDRNRDGFIDRKEAQRGRWSKTDPFSYDFNGDDRISRMELAQRYAHRRLIDETGDELEQKVRRVGTGIQPTARQTEQRDSRSSRSSQDRAQWYFTLGVLGRFDKNRNGRLENEEAVNLAIPLGRIDDDQDGEVSRDELHEYLMELQEDSGDDIEGLPGWFYELDEDRDEQITMAEFSETWSDEKLQEFLQLDTNEDGLLTSSEVLRSKSMVGGSYRNQTAEVLPPGKTIISEINIDEDFLIGDLNVRLSITHSHTQHLDAYLIDPEGNRVELFTAVGSSGDNFENTVFDDQSGSTIVKGRAPFRGTYSPEALVKRQPGLSQFTGKSIQGVWQLMIGGSRNDRFGMLHGWSLLVKPQDRILEVDPGIVSAPTEDPVTRQTTGTFLARPEMPKPYDRSSLEKSRRDEEQIRQEHIFKAKEAWEKWMTSRGEKGKPSEEEMRAFKEKIRAKLDNKLQKLSDKNARRE